MSDQDFLAQVIDMAGKKVGYAVERNVPLALQDIKRQKEFFDDETPDADKIEMSIKVAITSPSNRYVRIEVASVTWATKFKRTDRDFEPGEIDSDNPFLPGMDAVMSGKSNTAPEAEYKYETIQEKNLLAAAAEIGARVFRECRDMRNLNCKRSIDEWTGKNWRTALCEDVETVEKALKAAQDTGNIVLQGLGGWLTPASKLLLLSRGYDVIGLDKNLIHVYSDKNGQLGCTPYSMNEVPLAYKNIDLYREGGGIDECIYPDASQSPVGCASDAKDPLDYLQVGPDEKDLQETIEPRYMRDSHLRNASKMIAAGLRVYYMYTAPDDELNWIYNYNGKEWAAEKFANFGEALRREEEFPKQGYFNPVLMPNNLADARSKGFGILDRKEIKNANGTKYVIYHIDEKDNRTTMAEFRESEKDSFEEAWDEVLKTSMFLERS